MAVTAGTLLPVDFTPPGQPTPNENGHDSHNDAFHLLTSDNNAILPNTSTSPPTIVQVRRGGLGSLLGDRDGWRGFELDGFLGRIPGLGGGLSGDLAKLGGIGVVAGLLLAVLKSLAEMGNNNHDNDRNNKPEASPRSPGDENHNGRDNGAVHPTGFTPIAPAYSGDDKAPPLQQGALLDA